jgi:hypothetical protein
VSPASPRLPAYSVKYNDNSEYFLNKLKEFLHFRVIEMKKLHGNVNIIQK